MCEYCPASFFCQGGRNRKCLEPDTFSFGKSSECMPCKPGWRCVDGYGHPCPVDTFKNTSTLQCDPCPRGSGIRCAEGQLYVWRSSVPDRAFQVQRAYTCLNVHAFTDSLLAQPASTCLPMRPFRLSVFCARLVATAQQRL